MLILSILLVALSSAIIIGSMSLIGCSNKAEIQIIQEQKKQ